MVAAHTGSAVDGRVLRVRTRFRLPRRRRPAAGGAAAQRAAHQRARRGRGAGRAVQRGLPAFVAGRLAGHRPHGGTPVGREPAASRAAAPGRPRALRRPRRRGVSTGGGAAGLSPTSARGRLRRAGGPGDGTPGAGAGPRPSGSGLGRRRPLRRGRPQLVQPRCAAARPGPGARRHRGPAGRPGAAGHQQRDGRAHRRPGPSDGGRRPGRPCRAVPAAPWQHAAAGPATVRPADLRGGAWWHRRPRGAGLPGHRHPVRTGPHPAPGGRPAARGHPQRRSHRRRGTGGGAPSWADHAAGRRGPAPRLAATTSARWRPPGGGSPRAATASGYASRVPRCSVTPTATGRS